ncbi:DUF4124 domain-containing protein [Acinetobacter lwoffii]|uniref:DUF4124 domain-containing protein n=2 Tax=Acinetobacter TaxID=469 RepID=N9M7Y0_9GAMM|nr:MULTISPECIES: DUF4124 domain-containing protein [Acinetobacter]ENU16286.1 hypothetical protein F995_01762 [Acinetobacter sp. CIP A162]ENW86449.1 hypothetical protein F906_01504 [Acinetobacter pseudolwoffii]ESJ95643.1 hypothetical protein P800_00457 [Acinetobacter lwoffii NCTC 5866 = CIP 64.10 = NIPH 512]QXB40809.1 DUF4124 domain-containing protein [Acinetobacter lwoffii]SUU31514.1 Uncharacterised protein [Acinetobacter lwoffii]
MNYFIGIILGLLVQNSFASQVYTCTVNGKTVYQGKPCAGKESHNQVQQAQAKIKGQQATAEKEKAEWAARKEPRVGMTKAEAEKSTWGYPDKINTTTTTNNVFEQWIYRTPYSGSKYLHFTNGKITSVSN